MFLKESYLSTDRNIVADACQTFTFHVFLYLEEVEEGHLHIITDQAFKNKYILWRHVLC